MLRPSQLRQRPRRPKRLRLNLQQQRLRNQLKRRHLKRKLHLPLRQARLR
jgi:hypothetical protein